MSQHHSTVRMWISPLSECYAKVFTPEKLDLVAVYALQVAQRSTLRIHVIILCTTCQTWKQR